MTYFDVRILGLKLRVVAADGQYVHPVSVDEFRIAPAETYDIIVEPSGQDACCNKRRKQPPRLPIEKPPRLKWQ